MKINISKKLTYEILNKNGNNNKNSTSYKIKKTHNIEKFILTWIWSSEIDLKPHS